MGLSKVYYKEVPILEHQRIELMDMMKYNIEQKNPQRNNPTALSITTSLTRDEIHLIFQSWHAREHIDYFNGVAYLIIKD